MFGVKTTKGWLRATSGETRTFFVFDPTPQYPFRDKQGATQVAQDWLERIGVEFEVRGEREVDLDLGGRR